MQEHERPNEGEGDVGVKRDGEGTKSLQVTDRP